MITLTEISGRHIGPLSTGLKKRPAMDPFQVHRFAPPAAADRIVMASIRHYKSFRPVSLTRFGLWIIVRIQRRFRERRFLTWLRTHRSYINVARIINGILMMRILPARCRAHIREFLLPLAAHAIQRRSLLELSILQLAWTSLPPLITIRQPRATSHIPGRMIRFTGSAALQATDERPPPPTIWRSPEHDDITVTAHIPLCFYLPYPCFAPRITRASLLVQDGRLSLDVLQWTRPLRFPLYNAPRHGELPWEQWTPQ